MKPAEKIFIKEVVTHLRELEDWEDDPEYVSLGLCDNLQFKFKISLLDLRFDGVIVESDWEHFSGNEDYPVPAESRLNFSNLSEREESQFLFNTSAGYLMWGVGRYAELRRLYCGFIADCLESLLELPTKSEEACGIY